MSENKSPSQEHLVKNNHGEYHVPEWIEVFRKGKKRRKGYILQSFDYMIEKKYG